MLLGGWLLLPPSGAAASLDAMAESLAEKMD
jgi:hypothetical protein